MPKHTHAKTGGDRCHAFALLDKPHCYYHMHVHRVIAAEKSPEVQKTRRSISLSLSRSSKGHTYPEIAMSPPPVFSTRDG